MSSSILDQSVLEGTTGRFVRVLAQRMAAYVPTSLTRKILGNQLPEPGRPEIITAAAMFADLSGFTRLAEARAADGARGTEALSRTLLMTFTALVNAIHDAGGEVSHFHGDAMMIYFADTDGKAASRALASAKFLQRLVATNFAAVHLTQANPHDSAYPLSIKIGVGFGRCLELVVGDTEHKEFLVAGTAVDEAVSAQTQADAGQVVASQAALEAAGMPVTGPFRVVAELPPVPGAQEGLYWEAYKKSELIHLVKTLAAFIPASLVERLQDRNTQPISEHRSVTSLFVQFSGINFDDPAAGEQLQVYYQWAWRIVQQYGGANSRVNRVLTGDKGSQLHILFGAPVAPNAPEQAIRCALALQEGRPDFITAQQIGLAAGRVFAGVVGSLNRREYTVVGQRVNLSARLTQICPPDAILVDAETAARVQSQIISQPLPPVALKGLGEPVAICRVIGERSGVTLAQARFQQWVQPPVGRERELDLLYGRMAAALQGRGALVAVYGPHGSGQMPFLAAGVRHWLEGNGRGLVGVCQEHTADVAYTPWVSVWRDFFELTPEMTPERQLARVSQRVQQLVPVLAEAAHLWRELLGSSLHSSTMLVDLSAVERQMRLFNLVRHCVAAAAQEKPLLIVLEDIHLADQASLDLLDALAEDCHSFPLLLLVTYRTGANFHYHTLTQRGGSQIALNDFSPQQARRLVRARLGTDQLPSLVEQRLGLRDRQGRESAVNPLFLEESLQMMLSLKVVEVNEEESVNGRIRINEAQLAKMQVPDTIYTLLLSRLDRLPAAERSLLQTASVIGREFDLTTLVSVSPGLRRETAVALLNTLVQTDLIQPLTTGLVATYLFQHNLIHQVVYQSLTYARRQALHANIADLIIRQSGDLLPAQYPVLAYHLSQTDQHQKGLKYALSAAREAENQYNHRGAAEFYKQASQHLEALGTNVDWETAVSVAVARAKTLLRLGQFTEAGVLATEAMKLCLDHAAMSRMPAIYNLIAEIRLRQAHYTDVIKLTNKVIYSLLPHARPEELAGAYLLWGQALAAVGERPSAFTTLNQAEDICRSAELPGVMIFVRIAQADLQVKQHLDTVAIMLLDETLNWLNQKKDPLLLGQIHLAYSRLYLRLGQAEKAMTAGETAVVNLRLAGPNSLAQGLTQRAAVFIYQGKFEAALTDLRMATRLFNGMDDKLGQLRLFLLWAVQFSGGLGDWRQAKRRLDRAGKLLAAQPQNEDYTLVEALEYWLGQGLVALHTENWEQAEPLLWRVKSVVSSEKYIWWQPAVYYAWGLLLLEKGAGNGRNTAVTGARQAFQTAQQAVADGGCPDELPLILLQLGLIAQQMGDVRCWQYFESAVAAAHSRARHADRLHVFRRAGQALLEAPDNHLIQLGQDVLSALAI